MKENLKAIRFFDVGDSVILRNPKTNEMFRIRMRNEYCDENNSPRITPLSQMLCWSKYTLGDTNPYHSMESALFDIAQRVVGVDKMLDFIREGKTHSLFIVKEAPDTIEVGIGEPDDFGDPTDIDDSYKIIINSSDSSLDSLQRFKEECLNELDATDLFALLDMKARNSVAILPIFIYDHGSISLSANQCEYPYCDLFDTDCIGFIIIEKSVGVTNKLWAEDSSDEEWHEKAVKMLTHEVEMVNSWLNGHVYTIDIEEWVAPEDDSEDEDIQEEDFEDDEDEDDMFQDYSCYGSIYTWNDSDIEDFIAFIKEDLFHDSSLRDEDIEYID